MNWILVMIITTSHGGVTATTEEFSDEKACQAVVEWSEFKRVKAKCFPRKSPETGAVRLTFKSDGTSEPSPDEPSLRPKNKDDMATLSEIDRMKNLEYRLDAEKQKGYHDHKLKCSDLPEIKHGCMDSKNGPLFYYKSTLPKEKK
jgi:hypothetical protein